MPGDKILLQGGKTFKGNITFDSLDSGKPGLPVTLSTYGKGKAVIKSGNQTGIYAENCSFITLKNLRVLGNGVDDGKVAGIHFYSSRKDISCKKIIIDNCEAAHYNQQGIFFSTAEDSHVKGYDDVRIVHCNAYNNGEAGISSYAVQTGFHHSNFYIAYCKAYNNKGILTKTSNHSGNGIVMGQVENLLIEHCEAYENGASNRCTGGGPVGIWVWLCKNAVIQYCESHNNHAGLTKDGGGFDIDGGSVNCTVQFNYSHDNEGAGYLLAEYGAGMPFENNIIRFNISRDDGRKNNYGGISVWGVDSNNRVNNSYIYNNAIFVSGNNVVDGIPCAFRIMGPHCRGVRVMNNLFTTTDEAQMINSSDEPDTAAIYFLHNNYYSYNRVYDIHWGRFDWTSIGAWQGKMNGQESENGTNGMLELNPRWVEPGKKLTAGDTRKLALLLNSYRIGPGSAVLKKHFPFSVKQLPYPPADFFGKRILPAHRGFVGIEAY